MTNITIDFEVLKKFDLNINEYLVLYDIVNEYSISSMLNYGHKDLIELERKAFIKITEDGIHLRAKSEKIFSNKEDYFAEWLKVYPTTVKKKFGGTRTLSPSSLDSILANKLRKKWDQIFKKNINNQLLAIKVLKAEVADKTKSGDLEYMVEATRWLNEGFHEKMEHLLDKMTEASKDYNSEDWL